MVQGNKELFLKDLSARLLYGVHCCVLNLNKTIKEDNDIIYGIVADNIVTLKSDKNECYMYYQIKPYLRPMSSMTEEEKDYIEEISHGWFYVNEEGEIYPIGQLSDSGEFEDAILPTFEWLNANHFDYRNLIGKGLALEAKKGMYGEA